ncbi:pilus assembly protein N-terminal domain-containing protein [Dysgonomonas sp. 25]|uniref:pilus assembly protein N-terminal domain-containing protein n=1 Tax=Dysgonomonas sp. 25 TaxID=2302933 RepID=UPI0013D84C79|nr:pilus assembly protein N-terminal domain-containing protein [Dysgonomonas sp. 25]NDV67323.1 hypothetical protein [Dysgonomonas sp. 25]
MKRNIIYLIGFILIGTSFMSCDSDDDKKYSDLVLDTELLTIDLDNSTEGNIHIVQGNGNYKLTLSNDRVATVALDNSNTIRITGLESGKTELTITDWAKKTTQAQIVVKKLEELLLDKSEVRVVTGETASAGVYSGNGEYTITSSDESIAKATIDEDGNISIEGVARGTADIEVVDAKGKTATIEVKVRKPLVISQTEDVPFLVLGETLEVDILDGNGGYSISASSTYYLNVTLTGTKAFIRGNRYGKSNATFTIKDAEDNSVSIRVMFIDDPYLNDLQKYRYFVDENTPTQTATGAGDIAHSPEFNLSQIYAKSSKTSSYASGFGVRFSGDLTVGSKDNAFWFRISSNRIDESSLKPVTDLRIDKVDNGWYWVSFMTEGKSLRSYIVTKKTT